AAWSLITKIVNALCVLQETGGPYLCASLLGSPEQYTDKMFKVFHWYSYVQYVDRSLDRAAHDVVAGLPCVEDRVVVGFSGDKIVPLSRVNDYVYRPTYFEQWSLYDYLRRTIVKKKHGSLPTPTRTDHSNYSFIAGHPQRDTHVVFLLWADDRLVLNFVGTALPRKDQGDRVVYVKTMLTFFKPWRKGSDLLQSFLSWSEAFDNVQWCSKHSKVMGHMNVLYECLDARDDYSALRRVQAGHSGDLLAVGDGCSADLDGEVGVDKVQSFADQAMLDLFNDSSDMVSAKSAQERMQMDAMCTLIMQAFSRDATSHSVDSNLAPIETPMVPHRRPAKWRQAIAQVKALVVQARLHTSQTSPKPTTVATAGLTSFVSNESLVKIMSCTDGSTQNTIQHPGHSLQDSSIALLHGTLDAFTLNNKQMQAFVIAARSLHHRETSPLLLYLGGMGGTGKSRVLNSLMYFLTSREEAYRFLVLVPTGSAASLVDGATYHSAL
ncbi:hypothetical protein BKA93DRAFT_700230, partial [Sparassis latifolia]